MKLIVSVLLFFVVLGDIFISLSVSLYRHILSVVLAPTFSWNLAEVAIKEYNDAKDEQ